MLKPQIVRHKSLHEALTRYTDRSIRNELWSWSKSFTNFSFCKY